MVGCTTGIVPPAAVREPAIVYVADHGKHSSILLPDGDVLEGDGYLQYAFGDWRAFVLNDNSLCSYLRAAFFSGKSALGREPHPTTRPAELSRRIGVRRLSPVTVEASEVETLRAELERLWIVGKAEQIDNRPVRMSLVPYRGPNGRYAVWNQCNHFTARWLRRMGCEVGRPALFSDFRVR